MSVLELNELNVRKNELKAECIANSTPQNVAEYIAISSQLQSIVKG
jgi:hypothetical protein